MPVIINSKPTHVNRRNFKTRLGCAASAPVISLSSFVPSYAVAADEHSINIARHPLETAIISLSNQVKRNRIYLIKINGEPDSCAC